jgi:hypothetical protein
MEISLLDSTILEITLEAGEPEATVALCQAAITVFFMSEPERKASVTNLIEYVTHI